MNMVASGGRQLFPLVVTVRRLSTSGTSSARLAGVEPESAIGDRVAIESSGRRGKRGERQRTGNHIGQCAAGVGEKSFRAVLGCRRGISMPWQVSSQSMVLPENNAHTRKC